MKKLTIYFALSLLLISCKTGLKQNSNDTTMNLDISVNKESFQKVIDDKRVDLFTLKNKNGVSVLITNYGARIVSVFTPDKNGDYADIALGYNTLDEYLKDNMYLGCIAGRYANRIAEGKFSLEGEEYTLSLNDGPNTLHGGKEGLDKKVWEAKQEGNRLMLQYTSPDMEEGYPGDLEIKLIYELNDENELSMDYVATTDKATVVNLTNHAYYNLKGDGAETILDHFIQINSDSITPVDETLIPDGTLAPVEGTPFNFREPKLIGQDIEADNIQLKYGQGYDHNWVLSKESGELGLAIKLSEPTSGRVLEIYTTEPAIQFYCGNFMDGTVAGKSGKPYLYRSGVALEPQHYPDSPNHPNFPSTVLKPGETYTQKSVVKFSVGE